MIGRRHRFHGYGSLKRVYRDSKSVRGRLVSLKFKNRGPNKPYRVAVVVSRKVSKSAVTRNLIRRRIYEAVRLQEASISPGTDLVFTVFNERVADLQVSELQSSISELISKASSGQSA